MKLFWIFLIIAPITDFIVLIKIGYLVGILPIISLSLFSALLGWLWPVKRTVSHSPMMSILNMMIIKISKGCLIIPGILSSIIGLLGLIPFIKQYIALQITDYFQQHTSHTFQDFFSEKSETSISQDSHHTLEGEFSILDPEDPQKK
ncbi:MAG: FxsA family protein [Endozoicomonadaceae bacterium]|nr:FxsA family protein [Endozoicomonadaceae bacterium]MBE8232792.1 FxsA family protein [Endozoicomonadaceae bacterium]